MTAVILLIRIWLHLAAIPERNCKAVNVNGATEACEFTPGLR